MEKRMIRALAVVVALATPASAGPKEDAVWARLRARLERIDQSLDGVLGLSVKDLKTGATVEIRNLRTGAVSFVVASADGVGTKLKLAFETGIHNTVGADLVNHCANDILVQGARPKDA